MKHKYYIWLWALCLPAILFFAKCTAHAQGWQPNPKYAKQDTLKSIQCSGTTKKGERCKMRGKANPNLKANTFLCRWHINQQ